ncbi:MAG: DUF4751 family protein, partial [Gemmatimonadetes bacterium]|nr:DUF4751 family protein [Gemmatimonadota bacterium]
MILMLCLVGALAAVPARSQQFRTFIHAPGGDFNLSHEDVIINYQTWDGSLWTAKVSGNTFIHAPGGDFNSSHTAHIINYVSWGGSLWQATVDGDVFTHAPSYNLSLRHTDTIINYLTWGPPFSGAPWTA